MEVINQYFPHLTETQKATFIALGPAFKRWNEQINVVSRKDIDNLYLHHILHSLSIARYLEFMPDSQILDLGTGGGLPGIPLALLFPEVNFVLIDARAKKIKVVNELCRELNINNVHGVHARAEEFKGQYDFVVSRAVAPLAKLIHWSNHLISKSQYHSVPNGLICLKGGTQLENEIKSMPQGSYYEKIPVSQWFAEPYFQEKFLVYVQH